MANQRSKNKKVISVPLPKELLERIEREAQKQGKNRVDLINEVLKSALKLIVVSTAALLIYHFTRVGAGPKAWNAAKLAGTAKAAWVNIQKIAR